MIGRKLANCESFVEVKSIKRNEMDKKVLHFLKKYSWMNNHLMRKELEYNVKRTPNKLLIVHPLKSHYNEKR